MHFFHREAERRLRWSNAAQDAALLRPTALPSPKCPDEQTSSAGRDVCQERARSRGDNASIVIRRYERIPDSLPGTSAIIQPRL